MATNTTQNNVTDNIIVFDGNRIDIVSFKIIELLSKLYKINGLDSSKLLVIYKQKQVEIMLKGKMFIKYLYLHSSYVDVLVTLEHIKHNVTKVVRIDDNANGLSFLDGVNIGCVDIFQPIKVEIKVISTGEFELFVPKKDDILESDDVLEVPLEKDAFEQYKDKKEPKVIKTMYIESENDIKELSYYLFHILNSVKL